MSEPKTTRIRQITTPSNTWLSPFMIFFYILFFLLIIFFILYPYLWGQPAHTTIITSGSPFSTIIDNFAQTITHKDLLGNSQLFSPSGTINFSRLMSWLPSSVFLTVTDWINQLDVIQAEFITNHMTLTNIHNISSDRVDVIGFYTYTLDTIGNTTNLPTIVCSFVCRFIFVNNLISSAEVLNNATCTFLWYSSAGVDGTPVIPMAKKAIVTKVIPDSQRWTILLTQIDILLSVNQRNTALSICNTTQFLTLKAMFDPMGTALDNQCNFQALSTELTVPLSCKGNGGIETSCLPDSYPYLEVTTLNVTNFTCPIGTMIDNDMCFPQRIATINSIAAFAPTDDFTLVGGPGIGFTGLLHGLMIRNLGILGVVFQGLNPILNATLVNQVLFLKPLKQAANTVYAGPVSGSPYEPKFRQIISNDIANVSATKIFGILPVENGGTGSGIPLVGGKFMISSFNNTIIEGPDIFNNNNTGLLQAGDGITIMLVNGSFVIAASPRISSINLNAPPDIFMVTSGTITNGPATLSFDVLQQFQNTFWAGPTNGTMGYPSFREIIPGDLPYNIPIEKLVGILPIEKGGTNSGTPLLNNSIMVSNNGQIVEASIVNGTGITTTINNGIIMINNEGLLTMSLSVPSDLYSVSGSPTSGNTGSFVISKQPQIQKTFLAGPITGSPMDPTYRLIQNTDLPDLLDGQVYIGSGGTPVPAFLMAGTNINITYGPGTIIISSGMGTGFTSGNGTVTSVGLLLPLSVFQIINSPVTNTGVLTAAFQNQVANTFFAGPSSGGAAEPTFRYIVIPDLPATPLGEILIGTGTGLAAKNLTAGPGILVYLDGNGNLVVEATTLGTVTSISITVPTSFLSVSPSTITSSGTFAITLISQLANTIFASPDGSSGIPSFRLMVIPDLPQTINGQLYIGSTGSSVVASTLTAGVGINILNGPGSITISTNISVGLSLPSSMFSITIPTVTSTGTLTATFQTQLANTFFAGPTSGGAAVPTNRLIVPVDLPALGNGQIYIGSLGTPTISSLSAGTGITITPGPGTITITNNFGGTVTSVGLSLPVSVFSITVPTVTSSGTLTAVFQTQTANTFFAGPTSGGAATPTYRFQVYADLPSLTNGQLYIGSGGVATPNTLTAGTGISITNGAGSILINATNTGTVTSVGLSLPSNVFNITISPITTTGTLTGIFKTQTANTVFAGPSSGGAATPTFRPLVPADVPAPTTLNYYEVSSNITISTFSSGTYTVMTTMTTTPVAGTYQVTFSASMQPSNSAGVYSYAVFNGAAQLSHSTRTLTGSSGILTLATQGVVIANGSNAVSIQWKKASGSGNTDMFERSMFLLRIS